MRLAGYLMPDSGDLESAFSGAPEDFPEDWVEQGPSGMRLRADRRSWPHTDIRSLPSGHEGTPGRTAWFLPGKFRFCPTCGDQPAQQARERNKLAGLSSEGRSSATTLLVSSILRWMNAQGSSLPPERRKLLGFTDNRQDAALQAGNFNDFLFVTLLRAATLAAVRAAGEDGLAPDDFGRRVMQALGFTAGNKDRRVEWMQDPEAKGVGQIDAERTLAQVLTHRVWVDHVGVGALPTLIWKSWALFRPTTIARRSCRGRCRVCRRPGRARGRLSSRSAAGSATLCWKPCARALQFSRRRWSPQLRTPWPTVAAARCESPGRFPSQEVPRHAAALMVEAPRKKLTGMRSEPLIVRGGPRSALAKQLRRNGFWNTTARLSEAEYVALMDTLLGAAAEYQIVLLVDTGFDMPGWRLAPNALRLLPSKGRADGRRINPYFAELYSSLAEVLPGEGGFFGRRDASIQHRLIKSSASGANEGSAGELTIVRS